jgi:hypothetical protein
MSILKIKAAWANKTGVVDSDGVRDALYATRAALQIMLGRANITEHTVGRHKTAHSLDIPVYYLAEWLAENWWILLFEPRKSEELEDSSYTVRHSIVSAQHGFPLPSLSITPFGRSVHLSCIPRKAVYADVTFKIDAFGDEAREAIELVLANFLTDTKRRLVHMGIEDTSFQIAWDEIQRLEPTERVFCELIGSLGLSPSEATDEIYDALQNIADILGDRAVRDFCNASTADDILHSAAIVDAIVARFPKVRPSNLRPLARDRLPTDNLNAPSWRRGMHAAKCIREHLGVDPKDPDAATKIFQALEIDTQQTPLSRNLPPKFSGALELKEETGRIALFQDSEEQRRFGAGRAAYLAWVSEPKSRRLMTAAVTRDQQASRQFAAEILVPQSVLKQAADRTGMLNYERLLDIASSRGAMPDVAAKQAFNAGLRVPRL